MTTTAEHTPQYQKAASLLKTQGILATVFGSIGIVFGIFLTAIFLLAASIGTDVTESERVEFIAYGVLMPFLFIIPHIYLVVSGAILLRGPSPKLAKGLSIANIVFGALWNLIILITAVLYVAQSSEYEHGYKEAKK